MDKLKINELYEQAHRIYEVPYESSVVDPAVVSIYKQKVWDRYLFAELIIKECQRACENYINDCGEVNGVPDSVFNSHFGIK